MWKEFKEFAFKGNLVDLAVAFILGAAFTTLVQSVVKDLITPVIAAAGGQPDFGALRLSIGRAEIAYGSFLNAVLNFLLVAAVLFMVVKAALRVQRRPQERGIPEVKTCPHCLEAIPKAATRCKYCTSELTAA